MPSESGSSGPTMVRPGCSASAKLTIDWRNADRLYYKDRDWNNPFAENMSAWLLKGYLDRQGALVREDHFVPDNIVIRFITP